MKKSIRLLNLTMCTFSFLVICICKNVNAQRQSGNDSLHLKSRIYNVKISTYKGKGYTNGYLGNLSDSDLYLSSSPVKFKINNNTNKFLKYNYHQIKKVIVQKNGVVGRSIGYGALIGFGLGSITALLSGEDFPLSPGELAVRAGGLLAGVGVIIGSIIGVLSHRKFIINGNGESYNMLRQSIFNKLLRHHSGANKNQNTYAPNL